MQVCKMQDRILIALLIHLSPKKSHASLLTQIFLQPSVVCSSIQGHPLSWMHALVL